MVARVRSWWQHIKIHPVRTVLIALVAVVILLIILSILGYIFNWHWTGLVPETSEPKQHAKTLWDWLQLLIIPAVLAVAGYVINLTISKGEQEATAQRAKSEREIAQDNQRETALQSYIDRISELLLEKKLRESQPEDEVRVIARNITLTLLPRLDPTRKSSVVLFLHESGLIEKEKYVIDLSEANLSGANLRTDNLSAANLRKTNLSGADLWRTNLSGADLSGANLKDATGVTDEELEKQTKSLEGATMPDGSIHP